MGCICSQAKPIIIKTLNIPNQTDSTLTNIKPITPGQNSHTEPTIDTFSSPLHELLQKNSLNKELLSNHKDNKKSTIHNLMISELQPTIEEIQEMQVDTNTIYMYSSIKEKDVVNINYLDFFSHQPIQVMISANSQKISKHSISNRGSINYNYLSMSRSSPSYDRTPSFSDISSMKKIGKG